MNSQNDDFYSDENKNFFFFPEDTKQPNALDTLLNEDLVVHFHFR